MNTSVAPNGGAMSPADADAACKELNAANEKQRDLAEEGLAETGGRAQYLEDMEGIPANPYDQAAIIQSLDKLQGLHPWIGMTFSSAKATIVTGSGTTIPRTITACSDAKAAECTNGTLEDGGAKDVKAMRDGQKNVLCSEANFKHKSTRCGAHGEAKIFNRLTALAEKHGGIAGGSVVFGTDWRHHTTGGYWQSAMPCEDCYKMMCVASKHCNMTIYLCSSKGAAEPLDPNGECDKTSKDPRSDPYTDLATRLGERPSLGHTKLPL